MFSKAALTFLVVGALSANALIVPVPRSPGPEPGSQELEAWMLKRDLSYELFSREPKDWAEWAGSARDYYTAKREPSPGGMISKPAPEPKPGDLSTYVSFPNFKPDPQPSILSKLFGSKPTKT